MSAGSMCLGVAALLIFGQICAEGQAGTENRTAGLASLEPASLFADEFHWRVSSAERFLISPRSAIHADTFPTCLSLPQFLQRGRIVLDSTPPVRGGFGSPYKGGQSPYFNESILKEDK